MAQIVTAQFVGQTSCGFVRNKYYEIEISAGRSGCLCVQDVQGQGFCPYSTLAALRKNWKIINNEKSPAVNRAEMRQDMNEDILTHGETISEEQLLEGLRKLFLCLTVRQTEKRVSGHSVRPPVLCCVLCGRFCVPMSARPVWGRLGLHQRRRVPSALRVAWVRTWKFAHILRRAVPGRELRRPAAPPCGPCVRRPAFCYRRRSPPGSWPWGRRPARRA